MGVFRREEVPLGRHGENLATRYLRRQGYRILGRNVQLGRYEIDIIARKKDTTVFVEVKTRTDDSFARPEDAVNHTKRQHIRKAAHMYIGREDDPAMYYRFDVAAVLAPEDGKPVITYFENAFFDE